jgi:hypothetical protein
MGILQFLILLAYGYLTISTIPYMFIYHARTFIPINEIDPNNNSSLQTLEESLSITTGRCDLAIATHARKMHKKISI